MSAVELPEQWRPVNGYPKYEVSDRGRVRSWRCGHVRLLKPAQNPNGYLSVTLCSGGRQHTKRIHLLVLSAFAGPRPPGLECRHYDGVRTNNAATNLRWGTRSENAFDRVRHGHGPTWLIKRKLTADDVRTIRQLRSAKVKYRVLASRYGVSINAIFLICSGKNWKSVA